MSNASHHVVINTLYVQQKVSIIDVLEDEHCDSTYSGDALVSNSSVLLIRSCIHQALLWISNFTTYDILPIAAVFGDLKLSGLQYHNTSLCNHTQQETCQTPKSIDTHVCTSPSPGILVIGIALKVPFLLSFL